MVYTKHTAQAHCLHIHLVFLLFQSYIPVRFFQIGFGFGFGLLLRLGFVSFQFHRFQFNIRNFIWFSVYCYLCAFILLKWCHFFSCMFVRIYKRVWVCVHVLCHFACLCTQRKICKIMRKPYDTWKSYKQKNEGK